MKTKNKLFRALCCLLAGFAVCTFSGCAEILEEVLNGLGDVSALLPENRPDDVPPAQDENSGENSGGNSDENSGENSAENGAQDPEIPDNDPTDDPKDDPTEEVTPQEPTITPTPSQPSDEKTVLKEEIDEIGHKIAYYTDGTWEDLGRVVALNTATPAPETQYGYTYFSKLENGQGLCDFYKALYNSYTQTHYSDTDFTADEDGLCEADSVNYKEHGITAEQAIGVWKTFVAENPLYYWSGLLLSYDSTSLIYYVDESYALAQTRAEINEDVREMVYDCDGYLSGKTTVVERALTIYDYLATRVEYAYEADGVTPETELWAHNIVGATQGKGVCETYAKTYDYLCGLFGLNCLTVVGSALQNGKSAGHAWNMIQLENEWYNVDVTWGDQQTLTREWFGTKAETFDEMHVADKDTPWGIEYQYGLPTLSQDGLCPVLFGEEEGEKRMEKSIDSAFAKMQNEGGRYEITLYPDTTVTTAKGISCVWEGASFSTQTLPKVERITFIGKMEQVSLFGYYIAKLSAEDISLQGNVTMNKVDFSCTSLTENGYTLTEKKW